MEKKLLIAAAVCLVSACHRASDAPASKSPEPAVATSGPAPESAKAAPAAAAAPAPKPRTFTAPAGHALRMRTTAAISTRTARPGDSFSGVLSEPLTASGVVIAPRGAAVAGVVAAADPGGKVKGVASLAVRLTRIELADGRSVDVVTTLLTRRAPATKKKDALKVGIGSGIGAAIGAIAGGGKGAAIGAGSGAGAGTGAVLLTRGDPAVIPSESLLTFTLRKPVSFTR